MTVVSSRPVLPVPPERGVNWSPPQMCCSFKDDDDCIESKIYAVRYVGESQEVSKTRKWVPTGFQMGKERKKKIKASCPSV